MIFSDFSAWCLVCEVWYNEHHVHCSAMYIMCITTPLVVVVVVGFFVTSCLCSRLNSICQQHWLVAAAVQHSGEVVADMGARVYLT
jgi:hypothetical protein